MTIRTARGLAPGTHKQQYDNAVKALAKTNITVVITDHGRDKYEAWEAHGGDRVLLAFYRHAQWRDGVLLGCDGPINPLMFSHPYWDLNIARAGVRAFQRAGCAVAWTHTRDTRLTVTFTKEAYGA